MIKSTQGVAPLTIFGLGRMGAQIAKRLHKRGFKIYTWNRSIEPVLEMRKSGVFATNDLEQIIDKTINRKQRIFWLMLPHNIIDEFLFGHNHLAKYLKKGDIIIDGGNSYFKDSIKRAARLEKMGIFYFDCGTSGGVWGEKNGFALMVGGPRNRWSHIEPYIKALSAGDNYAYCGKSGSGHFVKMIHNGIEYGMMEAIAEGYAVMHASNFDLNLRDVTRVYQSGSVVRSWLIDLVRNIFEDEDVEATSGKIDATGEGEWTVKTGKELGVDVRVIEDSLNVRRESILPKNQKKFSNKLVSLMRKQFGGHKVEKVRKLPGHRRQGNK